LNGRHTASTVAGEAGYTASAIGAYVRVFRTAEVAGRCIAALDGTRACLILRTAADGSAALVGTNVAGLVATTTDVGSIQGCAGS
jgi:hypothetical protein